MPTTFLYAGPMDSPYPGKRPDGFIGVESSNGNGLNKSTFTSSVIEKIKLKKSKSLFSLMSRALRTTPSPTRKMQFRAGFDYFQTTLLPEYWLEIAVAIADHAMSPARLGHKAYYFESTVRLREVRYCFASRRNSIPGKWCTGIFVCGFGKSYIA
jgi:hypothetical protein